MIEVCVQNIEDVILAEKYKDVISRIELNFALELGGLSPSLELLKMAKKITNIPIIAMLRCRAGDFNYSDFEHELHMNMAKELLKYADGLAFGALDDDFNIDVKKTKDILDLCNLSKKEFVFHRAIDDSFDYFKSVQVLDDLKVHRILTSGHEKDAVKGLTNLKMLKTNCTILAGAGISPSNMNLFLGFEIHGSFSKKVKDHLILDEEKLKLIK